jgi:hypothetical protein
LDLNNTKFIQHSDNAVKVTGSRFIPTDKTLKYTVKLEAAKSVGFRTVSIAACADPIMIDQIDGIVSAVKDRVRTNFTNLDPKNYFLDFKIYGQRGVLGMFTGLEKPKIPVAELAFIIEAVAPTQEQANTICGFARSTMLHHGYPGRKSTAGNLAFPFSPSDFKAGEVYEFSLYHLLEVENPKLRFPHKMVNCDKGVCHEIS